MHHGCTGPFSVRGAWIIWEAIFEGVGPLAFASMSREEPARPGTIIEQNAQPVLQSLAMQLETGLAGAAHSPMISLIGEPDGVVNEVRKRHKGILFRAETTCYTAGPSHDTLDCPVKNTEASRNATRHFALCKDAKPLGLSQRVK